MNQSTKIMFLIGLICNILEIVVLIVGIFFCAIAVGASDQIYQKCVEQGVTQFDSAEAVSSFFTTGVAACSFGLLFSIAVLVVSRLAKKAQEENRANKGYPITMIVLGALDNVFYLVAGILSLIENTQGAKVPAKAIASENNTKTEEVKAETEVSAPAKAETEEKAPAKKVAKKTETAKKAETAKKPTQTKQAKTTKTQEKPVTKPAENKTASKAPAKSSAKKTASKAPAKTAEKKTAKASTKKTSAK